jgi:hypothetical protein
VTTAFSRQTRLHAATLGAQNGGVRYEAENGEMFHEGLTVWLVAEKDYTSQHQIVSLTLGARKTIVSISCL